MSIYQKFCTELIGENGNLEKSPCIIRTILISDMMLSMPLPMKHRKSARLFGATPRMRNIFSPLAISKSTAIKWQMFWRMKELAAETW